MRRLSLVLLLGTALLGSCSSTGPEYVRRLGLIVEGPPPLTSLIAPGTVQRGASFVVTASTFGSSSCTHPDGYELNASATRVEIRLYDNYDSPNTPCTDDFGTFPRQVPLQFDQPGTVEVVVVGRGFDDKETRITRLIAIVP